MSLMSVSPVLPEHVLQRKQALYVWMAGIFLTSLIIANLTGSMLFSFQLPWGDGAIPVLLSAGIIPFPITFLLTDLLNEFYGKQGARFVTFLGFGMSILVYIFLRVGEFLPVDPISQLTREQYLHLSGLYTSMFVASLAAYLIGQLLDIQIFHAFKRITRHRLIWLRATGSTIISQMFDSIIVAYLAFSTFQFPFGILFEHPPETIFQLAMGNYVWKFLIAVAITPLLYLGHALIRNALHGSVIRGSVECASFQAEDPPASSSRHSG